MKPVKVIEVFVVFVGVVVVVAVVVVERKRKWEREGGREGWREGGRRVTNVVADGNLMHSRLCAALQCLFPLFQPLVYSLALPIITTRGIGTYPEPCCQCVYCPVPIYSPRCLLMGRVVPRNRYWWGIIFGIFCDIVGVVDGHLMLAYPLARGREENTQLFRR